MPIGLQVVRVRVIFRLPPDLGSSPHPLAYVHCYKPIQDTAFDANVNMYRVGPSTHNHLPRGMVISLDRLYSLCHLTPKYRRRHQSPPGEWIEGRTLDLCPTFYLNKYFNLHIFNEYEALRDKLSRS